jgi:probable F420-dependent oxidoreductase
LKISVTLSGLSRLCGDQLEGLLEVARIADAVGIHQIAITDHLMIGSRTDRYPYGEFPFPSDEPWPEPLTTLAAIAGCTSRIRLATGILLVPLRPPLLLAKTLATLDVLSRGRLDVGVGTGWQREEFDASDVPFEARGARMMDTLRACRVLWNEAPASFTSATIQFDDVWCMPQPIQSGGIPLHFGMALGPRTVERIVELGTGWAPIVDGPETLRAGIRVLRAAFREAGRDPAQLEVRAAAPVVRSPAGHPDLDATVDALSAFGETGVTVASFALAAFARAPEQVRPFLERLGKATQASSRP